MVEDMEATPLISVIVPIYNVEKYTKKCLDSLKEQSLKQIEVICIDDGSTDASGRIADEYESDEFPIFRIIHTENHGLSAARNRGIDEARSQWLMFIDSDDWVDKDFCRIPHEAAIENQADLVIFETFHSTQMGWVKKKHRDNCRYGFVSQESVIDYGDTVPWNKLYRKSLFNDIRFPEGRVYEDIFTTHKLIYKADSIYRISKTLYYHRFRRGSISTSRSSRIDEYTAKRQQFKELVELGYPKEKARLRLQAAALAYCGHAATTNGKLYREAVGIVESIKGVPDQFSNKQRMMLSVWRTNKELYRMIYGLLGKRMTLAEGKEK